MAGTGLVCLAVAVALVASGEVAGGVFIGCFSAAILLVPLARRVPDGSGPRLEPVAEGGLERPALVIAVNRARRVLVVLAGACFAAIGALMLTASIVEDAVFGAILGGIVLLVFGPMTLFGLWGLRGAWRLVLLPAGLRWDAGAPGSLVPWDEIAGVGVFTQSNSPFLSLEVPRPGVIERRGLARLLGRANHAISGGDLNVPLGQASVDPQRVAEAVYVSANEPRTRHELGTDASLRRLEREHCVADAARANCGWVAPRRVQNVTRNAPSPPHPAAVDVRPNERAQH
jgi:hypothetical protein